LCWIWYSFLTKESTKNQRLGAGFSCSLFSDTLVIISSLFYSLSALSWVMFDEMLPLYGKEVLNFWPELIAAMLTIQGVVLAIFQILLCRRVVIYFGLISSFFQWSRSLRSCVSHFWGGWESTHISLDWDYIHYGFENS
jgi:hypothetical protein